MTELPKFHETFIPILEVLKDGRAIHYNELKKRVRDTYYGDLNPEAAARTTRDGQPLILNRIGWAKSYLSSAGYATIPERALVQITQKGTFVTTSDFDQKAVQKARDAHHTIILIDGKRLTDLMYKYSVGLQTANT